MCGCAKVLFHRYTTFAKSLFVEESFCRDERAMMEIFERRSCRTSDTVIPLLIKTKCVCVLGEDAVQDSNQSRDKISNDAIQTKTPPIQSSA